VVASVVAVIVFASDMRWLLSVGPVG
jgi:hypothetical protein